MAQSFGPVQVADLELHSVNEALRLIQERVDQLLGLGAQEDVPVAPHTHAVLGEKLTTISPPKLKVNTHNYNPVGFTDARVVRLQVKNDPINLTGLQAVNDGDFRILHNISENTITLVDESPLSLPENRFALVDDFTLTRDSMTFVQYDGTSRRWRSLVSSVADHTHEADSTGGDGSGGSISICGFTAGSVLFANSAGCITEDNANLFWDNTNNRLGIGTASPSFQLQVSNTGTHQFVLTDSDAAADAKHGFIRFSDGLFDIGRVDDALTGFTLRLRINAAGTLIPQVGGSAATPTIGIADNDTGFFNPSGGIIGVTVNGTERWRFHNNNLLVGTTTNPVGTGPYLFMADAVDVPTGLPTNAAGIYADDVGGTTTMFAIDEASVVTQIGPWGTYTPTLTNVANLDASTAYQAQYTRMGNVVIVSGKVDIDPTLTATATQLGISLPIASNIGAAEDCSGTAFAPGIAGQGAAIVGDAANNRAEMQWVATDVTNQAMHFIFSYEVI